MFTCVIMRFQNVNVSKEDIKWWRVTNDHANNQQRQTISTQGTNAFSITINTSGETLTAVLMINNLKSNFVGPYWVGMADGTQLSDVAFLSIAPSGMCIYVYAYRACVVGTYVCMVISMYIYV